MKEIKRVEFQKDIVAIRFRDKDDPAWVDERLLIVDCQKDPHVARLVHVSYHLLLLLVEHPDLVSSNDEVLQEWIGRLFQERPVEGHDTP